MKTLRKSIAMSHRSFLNIPRQHPFLFAGGLLLALAVVTGLMHFNAPMSSFHHLFYIVILAGSFFHGIIGGIGVALIAGLLTSPWSPVTATALPPGEIDTFVRFIAFLSVGLSTGWLAQALHRRLEELTQLTEDSIRAVIRALDAMDGATARHSEKVAEYATLIARQLNLPPAQVDRIRWAALLHDVGKLSIPPEVLNKNGPLNEKEWAIVKRHPVESVRIVGDVTRLHALLPAVRHHHERMDGRGYPDGVRGSQFPLEARIISVADAFDAMTSNRPYRAALSPDEAFRELRRNEGTQFDPKVVRAFLHARGEKAVNGRAAS